MANSLGFKAFSKCIVYCKCRNSLTIPSWTWRRQVMNRNSAKNYGKVKAVGFSNPIKIDQATSALDCISSADLSLIKESETGVLEPCNEDVSDVTPFLSPTYNLAAYANHSRSLQQFIKMGVDLHKVENKKGGAECILKLDFDKHVKMHLRFLHDVGVSAENFGLFVTKNPFIFGQSLENLEVRINYLEAKRFSSIDVTRIITANPVWLNFSTVEIDKRLGFFQRSFKLSGDEVRLVTAKRPRLITHDLKSILADIVAVLKLFTQMEPTQRANSAFNVSIRSYKDLWNNKTIYRQSIVAVKEDMGFSEIEAKALLLSKPKLYCIDTVDLKNRFDYVHNIMGISHEQLSQQPSVITFRKFHVQQRHEFLKSLGKAQYNCKLPGYISLDDLVYRDDVVFCTKVAKTSINLFNDYLKTL